MAWTELRRWSWECERCGSTREMVELEHDLGSREEAIRRWCACPISGLVVLTRFPLRGDPEVDPERS